MKTLLCYLCLLAGALGQTAWTNQSPSGLTDDVWGIACANETFVAVTGQGRVLSSADGSAWSSASVLPGRWLLGVARGAGLWVVVGDGGAIVYSADLRTWTAAKAATTAKLNAVIWDGGEFVAVGDNGVIVVSTDAQNWGARKSGTTNFLRGLAAIPSSTSPGAVVLVATGGAGTVLQSTDRGATWSAQAVAAFPSSGSPIPDLECVASHAGTIVAAGSGGAVAVFSSLATGKIIPYAPSFALTPAARLRGLAYGSGAFVAVGSGGTIFTSPDGLGWSQRFSGASPASATTETLLAVAFSDTLQRFVAVGAGGTILTSDAPPSALINVATRGLTTPSDPLIGGFVLGGTSRKSVLVRAVGPALSLFGVAKPLADPVLTVYDSSGKVVARNAGWGNADDLAALIVATAHGAFPLPDKSADSALLLSLPPGGYTAVITSASGASGTALFEAYAL